MRGTRRILKLHRGRKGRERRFGSYHADAVHFDGANSSVVNLSPTATEGSDISFSYWYKAGVQNNKAIWAIEPNDDETWHLLFTNDMVIQLAGAGGAGGVLLAGFDGVFPAVNTWHHVLVSAITNLGAGLKTIKVYIDDVDTAVTIDDAGAAFVTGINGLPFYLGNGPNWVGFTGDLADFWFAPNQSLLTAGAIPEATRRKFISASGKPVYLGADGSTPTGVAPAVFMTGAAATFAANVGTGGAFTPTNLTNASTSPSD